MGERLSIKTERDEQQLFNSRAIVAAIIVLIALSGIAGRMYVLQIKEHALFTKLSLQNYQRRIPIPPNRGQIYDRYGTLLAGNHTQYVLEVVRDAVPDQNGDGRKQYVDTDIMLAKLRTLIPLSDKEIATYIKKMKKTSRFRPAVLKEDLSEEEVAMFAVNKPRFPGVDIKVRMSRYYPYQNLASHVVGYVGRIDERDLKKLNREEYAGTTHIGKTGVEASHEERLHGQAGYHLVEVNAHGEHQRIVDQKDPIGGQDLFLSLDLNLQLKAESLLEGQRGAIVAIDPNNGEVLAMASVPSYDLNLFVNGISHKNYSALRDNPDRPLYNRALQGAYPPGSTIKPMVAIGGLNEGVIWAGKTTWDPGYFQVPGHKHRYRCWNKRGHGHVDLDRAIAQSCDTYFYDMAYRMGVDKYSGFMKTFGFGVRTGIDLPSESSGLMPTREWKERRHKQLWYPGDTVNIGIGQGYWLATPLQLAHATAALAKKGMRVKPRVLHATRDAKNLGQNIVEPETLPKIFAKSSRYWDMVITGMINTMHSRYGTAKKVGKGASFTIAGKTGTAQVFGIAQNARYDASKLAKRLHDHSLFVGFAPAKKPEIAVAVIVENGGSGGKVAAPYGRAIMDEYLVNLKGDRPDIPLPNQQTPVLEMKTEIR